jgi:hypothetical protein
MPMLTPQEVAKKWVQATQNSKAAVEAGVRAVTVSPTQKAAAKADKYLAGVQRAVDSRRFQNGLNRVTLQDWQNAMLTKGTQRIAGGVKEAEGKFTAFMSDFLPFVQSVQAAVKAMPDDTEQDRENRMLENVRRLRQFTRSR